MKTFIFNEIEYNDIETLGLAFFENPKLALESIQEKEFVKFINGFKNYKSKVYDALYESYSLQSALSIIIYSFCGKILIGNKEYKSTDEILLDVDNNPLIKSFISDKGLRKTCLESVEDEIIKNNIKSIEDYANDPFVYKFLKSYKSYDPNIDVNPELESIFKENEQFKKAYMVFSDEEFLLKLALKYNLDSVMKIKKSDSKVLDGLMLVKSENNESKIIEMIKDAYYLDLGKSLNKYKYKSIRALDILDEVSKKYKKAIKSSDLSIHKDYYVSYLKFVELYKKSEIIVKNKYQEYSFNVDYCQTLINDVMKEKHQLESFVIEEENSIIWWNLPKFGKAIQNHKKYVKWNLIFVVISLTLYLVTYLIPVIPRGFNGVLGLCDYILFGSALAIIALNIIIIIKNKNDDKRYNALCKLSYYKKNEVNLNRHEKEEYEQILKMEDNYSRKSDRHYSILGSITNGLLGIMSSLITVMLLLILVMAFEEGFINLSENLKSFYTPNNVKEQLDVCVLVLPAISLTLPFFIGFIRNKKTKYSSIFSVLFGFVITIVLSIIL